MKGPMFLSCFKKSRGSKQQYTCNCSSVSSDQFKTLSIHKSCSCELAWMVKRSESLKEATFRYTEENYNARKTNLCGSKSLPSTAVAVCGSSRTLLASTKSLTEENQRPSFVDYEESREVPIHEEQEIGTETRFECCGGQETTSFYFTGEDTSLLGANKEVFPLTPQVSPESDVQDKLQDDVEEENQFNESVDENEACFYFTESDTSLLKLPNSTTSLNVTKAEYVEKSDDFRVLRNQEVEIKFRTTSKANSCDQTDIEIHTTSKILKNSDMDPREVKSVPASLTTSFTGSMEESSTEQQERPSSLYRELNRIGGMSLVQNKLMCWKTLEEKYTVSNGKHLLPYGCSGIQRRKSSNTSKSEDNSESDLEVTKEPDIIQRDELDALVLSEAEACADISREGSLDIPKKESCDTPKEESCDTPKEESRDTPKEESCDTLREGSESPEVPEEAFQFEICSENSDIVQANDKITFAEFVELNCSKTDQSDNIFETIQSDDGEGTLQSDDSETVQSEDRDSVQSGDKIDKSETIENADQSDFEKEEDNSDQEETAQDSSGNVVRRRKSPSPRPERPKSEISVRWADLEESREITPVKRRESSRRSKQRPKSDLGGSSIGEDENKPFGSQICLLPYSSLQNLEKLGRLYSYDQKPSMRRMSTPHPIKTRLERTPRKQRRRNPLVRSHSMPESLDKLSKKKKFLSTIASSNLHREDVLYHYDNDSSSDEGSEFSGDQISLHEKSLASRLSASYLSTLRERPEPDTLTYAEALWDHITMDQEELGFRAGDVIEVADMSDKDWWWGAIDDREGWFPATFVRLRVNQEPSDLSLTTEDILEHSSPANRRISVINTDQARENVVNEIISAEREYVKHLKDVVEGYIRHARKREDMFSEDRISVIFGNMEDIYEFSQKFLEKIETSFVKDHPHLSQLGHCFLECSKEFEIYSDYCNNHPSASGELKDLYRNKKYRHFFEACRLLQEMIEIPLEGFLLTPVQKICKYPLQLNELLKYTPMTHPDHAHIKGALEAMKKIATLINERKRKMESIEKLAYWQTAVEDWQGPDLLEDSSELIFAGEMNKVNSAGWSQERNFFLFDHQLVYCKKDLLKKNGYSYKGRIDLDDSEIIDVEDGKVKNAWKIHETSRDKWYLLVARSSAEKEKWMKAFTSERKRVKEDQENNFVPLYWKRMVLNKIKSSQEKQRSGGQVNYQKDFVRGMPSHATLPRSYGKKVQKKKGWFGFGNKKTK